MKQRHARAKSPLDIAERWNGWMRALTLVISIAATAVVLTACGKANGEDKGGKGGFPPAPVSVQEVKTTTVPIRFEYVGQTAGSKEAEVRARVQGILEKRTYQEGSKVNAGQTLCSCSTRAPTQRRCRRPKPNWRAPRLSTRRPSATSIASSHSPAAMR